MKLRGTVMVVDDEAYVRDSLAAALERQGFAVRTAASVAEVTRPGELAGVDLVVADLKMPGEDGHALVRRLAVEEPSLPVVVLTGHGTVSSAVECMKTGAVDYLLKPTDPDELVMVIERALRQSNMSRELRYLRSGEGEGSGRREPIGVSGGWRRVMELAETAAPVDTSVLILGESGTGKEEVAKVLHYKSPRADGPFVRVNCAAIPSELFESEFFGHRRGAFTGAVSNREGRFRVAHGGTLFLDEINSLASTAQAKVLRVLQDGTFERVGDTRPTVVDVRLISASNADLASEVEAGRFRADLFYRINVMTLEIPPLRERRDDVPVLAEVFLEEIAAKLAKPVRSIHPETLAALRSYRWPGNVRELKNVIERGVLIEKSHELLPSSLPFDTDGAAPVGGSGDLNLKEGLAAAERRFLCEALERSEGVRREAAKLLGIDERNMAYYLRKHGLMEKGRGR